MGHEMSRSCTAQRFVWAFVFTIAWAFGVSCPGLSFFLLLSRVNNIAFVDSSLGLFIYVYKITSRFSTHR